MSKRILVLVHARQARPDHLNWFAFRDLLRAELAGAAQVEMSALTELTFVLEPGKARIYDAAQGYDLADFDLVVFRTISRYHEEAISVAAYCRMKHIRYIDEYIPQVGNAKLSCAFVRFEHGLPVPPTTYGTAESLAAVAGTAYFPWPLVLKDNAGKKGRNNYLVHDATELRKLITEQPELRFVMQSFIPNDGDYRILVLNGKPRMAILRKAGANGGHLNNTSQGGTAEDVPLGQLPKAVLDIAVKAAKLEHLAVAGVDIIIDKRDGKPYILEANRSPQIATGAFAANKTAQYAAALKELL